MATSIGEQLAQNIRSNVKELIKVCAGIDEETANRATIGRWSPKEILSHLLGPEGQGHLPFLRAFLDQDIPELTIEPENPFFTEERSRMDFSFLLSEVAREYEGISQFAEGLSKSQLSRKAHIPMLKESSFGEYPTLETWLGLLGGAKKSHLQFHTNHMDEILNELNASIQEEL